MSINKKMCLTLNPLRMNFNPISSNNCTNLRGSMSVDLFWIDLKAFFLKALGEGFKVFLSCIPFTHTNKFKHSK